jgi:hypothetical protein
MKTQNLEISEGRLLRYDIDVFFTIDLEKRQIERKIQDYYAHPESARTGYNLRVLAQFSLIYGDGTRWTFRMPLQY